MKSEREYRTMELRVADSKGSDYKVEGYASTFDSYVMFEDEDSGIQYCERIEPTAFDDCDFSDVVFRIDHAGAVYARTSAGTVELDVDDHGLHNITDLSKTENSRRLYEDIKAGNYPQMSFAFIIESDHYEKKTHTRVIDKVKKVFDISPVSFPANPYTELNARSRDFFDGVIKEEKAERLELERRETIRNELRERLAKSKEA